jgi:hypothetical protein
MQRVVGGQPTGGHAAVRGRVHEKHMLSRHARSHGRGAAMYGSAAQPTTTRTRVHARPVEPHPQRTRVHAAPLTPRCASLPRCRRSRGPPSSLDGERTGRKRQGSSSRYTGVSWKKARCAWYVQLIDPQTKRRRKIGSYASEEDAARAYDCAAVHAHGPGAKRNFPGEAIDDVPKTVGEHKKQRSTSRYIGVSWDIPRADDGPTDQAQAEHRLLCLRGGRSQGVRLCDCAGARTRRQVQLPTRGHQHRLAWVAACKMGMRSQLGCPFG